MKLFGFLTLCLMTYFLSTAVLAQTAATAKISGVVTDPNGAVVAGATVKLVNKATNAEKTVTTDSDGSYAFAGVDPAAYQISVSAQGFSTRVINEVMADVGKSVELDVQLQTGNIAESVSVTATGEAELQSSDASVGTVLNEQRIQRLPNVTRTVTALVTLQPGMSPGGEAAGSRGDQNVFNLDGLDVSDNVGFRGVGATAVPIPTEAVEQFGVIVSNPNASFGRSGGAQATIISKRGRNTFHGSGYWYHLNDDLAANSWSNNRLGLRRPEAKDNQFGFSLGGPIWKDRLFFFGHYEGLRRPGSLPRSFTVPTQSFRDGFLRFRDGTGAIQTWDLRTLAICGTAGNAPCDPRGLGANPVILTHLRQLPLPNAAGGDGLNSGVFSTDVPSSFREDNGSLRLDYQVTKNWAAYLRGSLFERSQPLGSVVDIPNNQFVDRQIDRPKSILFALTGSLKSNLINEFRVGHAFDKFNVFSVHTVTPVAGLNVPIDLLSFNEPVGVPRSQSLSGGNTEFLDNVTWVKGPHTFQFGGNLRFLSTYHHRDDKLSVISTIQGFVGDGANVTIPVGNRPPACSASRTTNCLLAADVTRYGQFYSTILGIVDNVNYVAVRDSALQPLPPGSILETDSKFRYHEAYFADTWKITSSLTASYGLQYQFNTAPEEKEGRDTVLVYRDTLELVRPSDYLEQRREAAEAGQIFNPDLAYLPVREAGRTGTFDIDYSNISPRIGLAWQPSFENGMLGNIFGKKKMVIRGGYSLLYDRLNTVSSAVLPVTGSGFAQTLTTVPRIAGNQFFRVGVDGPIPSPPPNLPQPVPVVPNKVVGFGTGFGELVALALDPKLKNPRSHNFNFTVQRELPWKLLVEVGYLGRFGRDLYADADLNSVPYFFRDPASGQTFAEAFDAIGTILRANPTAAVPMQPFFENQLPNLRTALGLPAGTTSTAAFLALGTGPLFAAGDVSLIWNVFLDGARDALRPTNPAMMNFNNRQIGTILVRTNFGKSNYHGLFVALHRRLSGGLTFDANYTLSKSEDTRGLIQNSVSGLANAYFPDLEYGPSPFDRRHVFNVNGTYDLPFGKGQRFNTGNWVDHLIGGWYVAGIYTASSGQPLIFIQGSAGGGGGVGFGGGLFLSSQSGAIAIDPNLRIGGGLNSGVAGSGGIGTLGNPNTGGTGLSLFANPEEVFRSFRPALLTEDTRTGRGEIRGFNRFNLDFSIGKTTKIGERVKFTLTGDFFNLFNWVNFNNPTLNTQNQPAFGVITGASGARRVQLGMRLEF